MNANQVPKSLLTRDDSVLLQVLLDQRVLASHNTRCVCKTWTKSVDSRQQRVHVSHIDGDGSLLGGFLARLPKLETIIFDKRFRSVPIRNTIRGGEAPAAAGGGVSGEAHLGDSFPSSPAKRVPSGVGSDHHLHQQQQQGTVREREQEKIKAACLALQGCKCKGLSVPFCRLQHGDLQAMLCAAAEGSGDELESLDLSGNFFSLEGTRLLCSFSFPCLTSLNIGSNDLNAAGIDALAACQGLCGGLRFLDISENGLDADAAPAVERLVASATSLTHLVVDHADWKAGYDGVFQCLATSKSLKSLRVRSAALGQEGGLMLSRVVLGATSLTELSVPKNSLNSTAASALSEALAASMESLQCEVASLDVSRNCIGSQGATAIAGMLRDAKALPLHHLDVSENQIGPDGSLALAEALRTAAARPLECLKLGSNAIGPIGATALAGALTGGARYGGLKDLDLSNNSIDATGATKICTALALCTQLRRLNLSHNRAGAQAMHSLGESLSLHFKGREREGAHMMLAELDISYNDIGNTSDADFGWLGCLAEACPRLYSLDLGYNSLKDDASLALANLIQHNNLPSLRCLGIAGNRTTDVGGQDLAKAFCGNGLLSFRFEKLDLYDNCFWGLEHGDEDTAESERNKVVSIMCEGPFGTLLPHQVVA